MSDQGIQQKPADPWSWADAIEILMRGFRRYQAWETIQYRISIPSIK